MAARLRRADRKRADRVTHFIANSRNIARKIERFYSRTADVLYPPVDTTFWTPAEGDKGGDYFLFAGRLVPYKRPDIAVAAANSLGVKLVVAGGGSELTKLRKIAGPTVSFEENPSSERLRDLYRGAKALVFPGTEDFGMTLVEAQACGTPVIAYGAGGALEAVVDGRTGDLYPDSSSEGLIETMRAFDPSRYRVADLRSHSETFAPERFAANLRDIIARLMERSQ